MQDDEEISTQRTGSQGTGAQGAGSPGAAEEEPLQGRAAGSRIEFPCGPGQLALEALAPDLVRMRFGRSMPLQPRGSWAVVKSDWSQSWSRAAGRPVWREDAGFYTLATGEMHVTVDRAPFRLTFRDGAGRAFLTITGLAAGAEGARVQHQIESGDHFYGFGQKLGFLDKTGQAMAEWATDDPHHSPDKDTLYQAIPFYLGLNDGQAYGLFLDSPALTRFDMGRTDPAQAEFATREPELDFYVFFGPGPKKVVERYTELTGRMEMPPLWSLGYQQSRYSYYPEAKVREIASNFRERDIPCDVIYLDIHYMDGYRVFTWDESRFPDPKGLLSDLAAAGFHVVPIIDPGVKAEPGFAVYDEGLARRAFIEEAPGRPHVGEVWPGPAVFPDFLREETRRWWGDSHQSLLDAGVAGIWNDMNEPANFTTRNAEGLLWKTIPLDLMQGEDDDRKPHHLVHNLYGMSMCRATREGLQRLRPEERPFLLTRSGYAGIQRYAAVWMGDNHSWWEHLLQAMPTCLGMGLSGVPFVGTDAGGFGGDTTPEMLIRWTQMGAFTPFFRNHSAIGTRRQEPWAFDAATEAIVRDWIRLRYRFLPYIYNAFEEAHRTGLPIMRPLLLEYPGDPNTQDLSDEYLLGRDVLVAPVYHPGSRHRLVYLPEGVWYDFWTGHRLQGPLHFAADTPLERMPLYVRAGAILPLAPVRRHTGEEAPAEVTLDIFPGKGETALYEDDGSSLAYQRGDFARTPMSVEAENGFVTLCIGALQGSYRPERHRWVVHLRGVETSPQEVLIDGADAEWSRDDAGTIAVSVPYRPEGSEARFRLG
ncbi:MAG: glycoside hydrolase family 31 protein [Firmicutes bacterium]|nr:glycoside hydrolase family 31 protein [Bacillota bacterium]